MNRYHIRLKAIREARSMTVALNSTCGKRSCARLLYEEHQGKLRKTQMTQTTYRMREDLETGELVEVSPWKRKEFQSFTGIVVATALIMSLIGVFKLATDVNVATNDHAPYINNRLDDLNIPYIY
jgi:hypothetical protein